MLSKFEGNLSNEQLPPLKKSRRSYFTRSITSLNIKQRNILNVSKYYVSSVKGNQSKSSFFLDLLRCLYLILLFLYCCVRLSRIGFSSYVWFKFCRRSHFTIIFSFLHSFSISLISFSIFIPLIRLFRK